MSPEHDAVGSDREPIVVNDKRRIDPDTGAVRPEADVAEASEADEVSGQTDREGELLGDLQRVTAEYANFRKRAERDRVGAAEAALARLLDGLLPLLDAVELARQHGDLDGAFKGVGEGLEAFAARQGLTRVGEQGDPFDPTVHHALMQAPEDPTLEFPVVAQVLQPGWRLTSGRVLRPAGVAVAEPPQAAGDTNSEPVATSDSDQPAE